LNSGDELERFKGLNLGELAAFYGYTLDRRESCKSSLVMRHADGDKVVIITSERDGHAVFFSGKASRQGSVLDFVMFREGCNLGQARKALRAYSGQSPPFPPPAHRPALPKPAKIPSDRAKLVADWHRFRPYGGGYLESRGLTPATVAAFADRLRRDERGNVCFRHDDLAGLCGWEKKNRGFTGYAAGAEKGLFGCRVDLGQGEDPPRLILAESALDAMSYHQHDPRPALVLSFGGRLSPAQVELLARVLTKYPAAEIVTATDADEQGDSYAATVAAIRPDAVRARPPTGKDWNDTLNRPAPVSRPFSGLGVLL